MACASAPGGRRRRRRSGAPSAAPSTPPQSCGTSSRPAACRGSAGETPGRPPPATYGAPAAPLAVVFHCRTPASHAARGASAGRTPLRSRGRLQAATAAAKAGKMGAMEMPATLSPPTSPHLLLPPCALPGNFGP
ncbi:uncharacterized protein Tco025E_00104 [Trypanosoma conorhini]|uniref:Uncharacterized protein n=1 Tax=Trypanosoma conorhini TaxID=83891 RepID=A0A3R7M6Z4_9TRYP|nr:uncharacterized protein Tco025E_00104 [Trypanosoma conorhini]RNF27720.1 hypothetical protein Tco025E_00104 [Trypanosoma conorhini]